MTKKRKLILGAKATNWAASVPGMITDWREIAKKAVPAAGAGASGLVPQVRGWIVDNTTADWIMIAIGIGGAVWFMWACVKFAADKRKEALAVIEDAQAQVDKIELETEEAKRLERATAVAQRVTYDTGTIAHGEDEIHPDQAQEVVRGVTERIVEEFIRHHPEAIRYHPPRLNRYLFIHWLVTYRRAENPDENSERGATE